MELGQHARIGKRARRGRFGKQGVAHLIITNVAAAFLLFWDRMRSAPVLQHAIGRPRTCSCGQSPPCVAFVPHTTDAAPSTHAPCCTPSLGQVVCGL